MALRALVLFALLGAALARRHRLQVGGLEREAAPAGEPKKAEPPADCYCHGCGAGKKCEVSVKACPEQDMLVYKNVSAAGGLRKTKCFTKCKSEEFQFFCLISAESACWSVAKPAKGDRAQVAAPEQRGTCSLE
mmetsp:Transcript_25240/g.75349  ORF Transcript_25240/g.75349 Transcript_25240/m.75349 type:complete len:134 (+) Transcript_25240:87-488(+)|eukprot:CAMPEP_0175302322 /NCGR_PEP_ID=MMETSP0093-20121207/62124_1 /TAXON_ID=311494 /ORGANISM="Alexandrium monilatum, Strain CCMP3105" /LENGTH=133 /DNA_ID=CAMNT_0016598625 /DNA_START=77 /DNA_END=478 /DNA_ORIENTATION=+